MTGSDGLIAAMVTARRDRERARMAVRLGDVSALLGVHFTHVTYTADRRGRAVARQIALRDRDGRSQTVDLPADQKVTIAVEAVRNDAVQLLSLPGSGHHRLGPGLVRQLPARAIAAAVCHSSGRLRLTVPGAGEMTVVAGRHPHVAQRELDRLGGVVDHAELSALCAAVDAARRAAAQSKLTVTGKHAEVAHRSGPNVIVLACAGPRLRRLGLRLRLARRLRDLDLTRALQQQVIVCDRHGVHIRPERVSALI